jgi:hypothetical protein
MKKHGATCGVLRENLIERIKIIGEGIDGLRGR